MSERRALQLVGMSASVLRYEPRDDGNAPLREQILALAHRHRRHGYRMIHLRLRQVGWMVNLKRVRRLYRQENLMVQKRKRKKVAFGDRQPLVRPSRANEVWSMDFVFDRLADGRSLKCLTVVDDATHESVAIVPDTAISGAYVTRILDAVKRSRGLPKVIRTDNVLNAIGDGPQGANIRSRTARTIRRVKRASSSTSSLPRRWGPRLNIVETRSEAV